MDIKTLMQHAQTQTRQPSAQSMMAADPFVQMAQAQPSLSRIYLLPGSYPLLYVESLELKPNWRGEAVFIAEFDILESHVSERPRGTRASWVLNFKHMPSAGHMKSFLAALLNCSFEQVTAEIGRDACSDANPLRGRLVRCVANSVITKERQVEFTQCVWTTVPEELQAQSEQLRKDAGFVY